MSDEERMAAVLAEHQLGIWDPFSPSCSCGQWRDKRDDGTGLAAHVAAELARAGFGDVEAEAASTPDWMERSEHNRRRADRAEAALASAKAEADALRAAVEAVVARMRTRKVDHRHADEKGAGSPYGLDGRAYFYAGDIYDDFADLADAIGESRVAPLGDHVVAGEDAINHPYRVLCSCGEWCYDFAAHRARVLALRANEEPTP